MCPVSGGSQRCLSANHVCDGVNHCQDNTIGADEEMCGKREGHVEIPLVYLYCPTQSIIM